MLLEGLPVVRLGAGRARREELALRLPVRNLEAAAGVAERVAGLAAVGRREAKGARARAAVVPVAEAHRPGAARPATRSATPAAASRLRTGSRSASSSRRARPAPRRTTG